MGKIVKPICRIGSGAGFAGDRIDPAVALAASGEVDAIALECLAERTLVPVLPSCGYNAANGRRVVRVVPPLKDHLSDRCLPH